MPLPREEERATPAGEESELAQRLAALVAELHRQKAQAMAAMERVRHNVEITRRVRQRARPAPEEPNILTELLTAQGSGGARKPGQEPRPHRRRA
jgi:hypothetical protein